MRLNVAADLGQVSVLYPVCCTASLDGLHLDLDPSSIGRSCRQEADLLHVMQDGAVTEIKVVDPAGCRRVGHRSDAEPSAAHLEHLGEVPVGDVSADRRCLWLRMERHFGQLKQSMVVATADHHDGADAVRRLRTLHLAAACRERQQHDTKQRGRHHAHLTAYGQVAGLALLIVTLVLMLSHHAPTSPMRWKTWSYRVLPK